MELPFLAVGNTLSALAGCSKLGRIGLLRGKADRCQDLRKRPRKRSGNGSIG
jgi:hypothetical protein